MAKPSAELKWPIQQLPWHLTLSVPTVSHGNIFLYMPSRLIAWWLKTHLFLQDVLKDDDPVDVLKAADAAPLKCAQGACSDVQKAAVCALARHQGAVVAGLAATSTEML